MSGVLVDGADGQQRGRLDGMGGKVSGACTRGTQGRTVLAGMAQRAAAGGSDALLGPALGKQGSRADEGERREREIERVDFDFSQNFQWKLEKV